MQVEAARDTLEYARCRVPARERSRAGAPSAAEVHDAAHSFADHDPADRGRLEHRAVLAARTTSHFARLRRGRARPRDERPRRRSGAQHARPLGFRRALALRGRRRRWSLGGRLRRHHAFPPARGRGAPGARPRGSRLVDLQAGRHRRRALLPQPEPRARRIAPLCRRRRDPVDLVAQLSLRQQRRLPAGDSRRAAARAAAAHGGSGRDHAVSRTPP